MNFSLAALALAIIPAASAKNIKLSRNLRKSSPVARALLSNGARPYNPSGRKLQENELDGSYSLKFSQCVDIKTYDQENEAYADEIAAGTVTPTKSYVIFHVCTDATCGYEGEDDLYIVDLHTYLGTVATFHAEKKNKYCEACGEFGEVCNAAEEGDDAAEEDAQVEGEGENAAEGENAEEEPQEENREEEEPDQNEGDNREEEGEGRKLSQNQRRTSKVAINCDQCQAYGCYEEDQDGDDLDELAAEWIQKVSECEKAEVQVNGVDVYYGAMCDDYGDGVELAVFLDDKCSLYTSQIAFNTVYMKEEGNDAYNYLTYAENYIKSAFSDVMSCDNVEYYDANEEQEDAAENQNNEMNDYCKEILRDGALSYSQCEADEDAQQLVTESGYAYDLAYGDDINLEEVCAVVKRMENAGEYFNAYDSSTSGTWYKRDKKGQIIVESNSQESGLSGGAIFGIIAAVAAVVGGAAFVLMKKKEKKGDIAESAEYQGGALS